jgi:glycosyltransferase involved in cell wall biosynthesis
MKILVLSFYYEPDLSAGSFRCTALVAALRARAPGAQIEVITTHPNRYHTFKQDAQDVESSSGLQIHRVRLPPHRNDIFGQTRAYLTFARQVLARVAERDYDLVFATSGRLMTGALAAWIARRKRTPLYLDIRDIFVDTIADVLPRTVAWPAGRLFSLVEAFAMRRADRINLVSRGFEQYFRSRYPHGSLSFFTNGIDEEFVSGTVIQPESTGPGAPATILYAGNIGDGQGLHLVLPELALALRTRANFVIFGDGARREALQSALMRAGVGNVQIRGPVPRAELLAAYRAADVLFLSLGSQPAFLKVLPSKVFEYAAMGKPILAGVAGYAAQFIREEISNAAVFAPGDARAGERAFESLDLHSKPRPDFIAKFSRSGIARAMADDVIALLPSRA